jgi:hypothetical protein
MILQMEKLALLWDLQMLQNSTLFGECQVFSVTIWNDCL